MPRRAVSHEKPESLFLCQTLPFPPDGGANIRSYHLCRLLARHFEVTALCFYRTASRPTLGDVSRSVEGMSELGAVEAFSIPQEHSRARWSWDHVRSVLRGRAYTVFAYESRGRRTTHPGAVGDARLRGRTRGQPGLGVLPATSGGDSGGVRTPQHRIAAPPSASRPPSTCLHASLPEAPGGPHRAGGKALESASAAQHHLFSGSIPDA